MGGGLGMGMKRPGKGIAGAGSGFTPVLTWTSGTAAYDPTFNVTNIALADVVELQIDDVNTFTSLYGSDTNTIDAAEALSGSLTLRVSQP